MVAGQFTLMQREVPGQLALAFWTHPDFLKFLFLAENPQGYAIRGEPVPTREYELTRERWQQCSQV